MAGVRRSAAATALKDSAQQQAEVVATGGRDCVNAIAAASLEIVSICIGLAMADDGFDRRPAAHRAADLDAELVRVADIIVGRYAHAHQFPRTRLGRLIRDIGWSIDDQPELRPRFAHLLDPTVKVRFQDERRRGPKVYCSTRRVRLHGIDRHAPKGGQFVLHAQALRGNPYDGYPLGPVITELEALTSVGPHPCQQGLSRPHRQIA
jgi:hypothetical protein